VPVADQPRDDRGGSGFVRRARPGYVQAGDPSRHISRAAESEHSLFTRWRRDGDELARNELVTRHLSLARKLATRYVRTQEPLEDLYQVAALALVKAVDRFEPNHGTAFRSFAVPTILGELKRHFRDKGYGLHLHRRIQELTLRVQAAAAELTERNGHPPGPIDIAEHLSVDLECVLDALDAISKRHAVSLDEPVDLDPDADSVTRHDVVGFDDQGYGLVETSVTLRAAINRLSERDREVLEMRFRDQLKQREIAERIGVSQMQVSRILRKATDELRDDIPPV
jgi:RNA polymerase sigma-B factor